MDYDFIEAVRYDGNNGPEIEEWSNRKVIQSPVLERSRNNPLGDYLQIKTPNGVCCIGIGDYVIKTCKGDFCPGWKSKFENRYEKYDKDGDTLIQKVLKEAINYSGIPVKMIFPNGE